MNESIKQAMHLDACKSFGAAEANENERRWDDKMILRTTILLITTTKPE